MSSLRDSAVEYARLAWPVLPLYTWRNGACACGSGADCPSPAKHPLYDLAPNGLKNASTDVDRIAEWWDRFPTANIGLRTGVVFDVLDVDGAEGTEALDQLTAAHGALPHGPLAGTGGGGKHLLFAATGVGNKAGLVHKVDWRGRNGYIVAPPSGHASGGVYEWIYGPETALEVVPDWLMAMLNPPRAERATGEYRALPAGIQDGTTYGTKAMDAELGELARAREGDRNHTLNCCAFNLFQLVAGGELAEGAVVARLEHQAAAIGLGALEIGNTIKSARTAGLLQPRSAPGLRLVKSPVAAAPASRTEGSSALKPDPAADEEPEPEDDAPRLLPIRWVHEVLYDPPPEPPVLIKGMLRAGELCVIGAPRAIGKSWFAMNLATVLAHGKGNLLGTLPVETQTKVLLSQGELDEWGSWSRWDKLIGTKKPPEGVAETFERWRIRMVRRRAASSGRSQDMGWSESEDYIDAILDGRVEATLSQFGFGVHIIDPWASYYAGAENSNDEAEAALDKLRDISFRLGVAVVIFAHFGKSNEAREPEDLWRGASRLADWASTRVTLIPHYTAVQAKERGMTRQQARRYVDVSFLRRSEPTEDFSIVWDPQTGWWDRWVAPEERQNEVAQDPTATLAQWIIAVLDSHPGGLSVRALVHAVREAGGKARDETIIQTAESLFDQDRVGMRITGTGARQSRVFYSHSEWAPEGPDEDF